MNNNIGFRRGRARNNGKKERAGSPLRASLFPSPQRPNYQPKAKKRLWSKQHKRGLCGGERLPAM